MSHYPVLVSAGPCTTDQLTAMQSQEVFDRVMERLEPYYFHPDMCAQPEIMEALPPDFEAHWDWFVIGGRWRGYFVAKSGCPTIGAAGTGEFLAVQKGAIEDPTGEMLRRRQTDVVVAGDIDWSAMRDLALARNAARYDECAKEGHPLDDGGLHPRSISRTDYLARESREYSPATLAICDADGWRDAPWGYQPPDVETRMDWTTRWHEYVDALDDDTLLVLVDCHE